MRPSATCQAVFVVPSEFVKIDSSAPISHMSGHENTSEWPSRRIKVRIAAAWNPIAAREIRDDPNSLPVLGR